MLDLHAVIDDSADVSQDLAPESDLPTVCVVGLGYVGLPVAVAFGKVRPTVGYDRPARKVRNLKRHDDVTGANSPAELRASSRLDVTDDETYLGNLGCSGHP
jgi:UDP-N-acetyl-D-galactosamine dehydrogenase